MPKLDLLSAACAFAILSVATGCPDDDKSEPRDRGAPPGQDAALDSAMAQSDAGIADSSTSLTDGSATSGQPNEPAPRSDGGMPPSVLPDAGASVPSTDHEAWLLRVEKLRSCEVVGEGAYPFFLPFHQRCESLCILAASCEQLRSEACDQEPAEPLEACFDTCIEDIVTCGDGQKVPSEAACDVKPDCNNGEDEKHCEIFACASGTGRVGGYRRCDGARDCEDGSDELGCARLCE